VFLARGPEHPLLGGHALPRPAQDLATGRVALSQQGRDLAVAHVEDVVEEKDGALGGREPLEQHQERHRDLVDHLDPPDAGVEAAWDEEIKQRIEEIDSGKVQMIPYEEVRRRIAALLSDVSK